MKPQFRRGVVKTWGKPCGLGHGVGHSLRRPKADGTSDEAARKTSGTERFHSTFSLNFDQFYQNTFKPITASISHCDHMDWHVKTWQTVYTNSTVRDICTFSVLCSVIWPNRQFPQARSHHQAQLNQQLWQGVDEFLGPHSTYRTLLQVNKEFRKWPFASLLPGKVLRWLLIVLPFYARWGRKLK